MQTLCVEMLEKLAHCHSLITSDRLLNQESTWSYESRASWSNYIRKVLNQTGPSGLWMWDFWAKVSTLADTMSQVKILSYSGMTASPQGTHLLAGPAKLTCPVQTHDPNDRMTEHYLQQFIRTSGVSPRPQEDPQSCHNALQVQILCLLNSKLTRPSSPITQRLCPSNLKT